MDYYDRNRRLIYGELTRMGFSCVKPDGAFYLFIKSPEPDEKGFIEVAKQFHIILVNGSTFACPGYVRLAYCTSYEMIQRSLPAFEELSKYYSLK